MQINNIKLDRFSVIMILLVLIVVIFLFGKAEEKQSNYISQLENLCEIDLDGKIVLLDGIGRGDYSIDIKTKDSIFKIESLPIAWEIKEYKIAIDDSISKVSNSNILTFYKSINGKYTEVIQYEILFSG